MSRPHHTAASLTVCVATFSPNASTRSATTPVLSAELVVVVCFFFSFFFSLFLSSSSRGDTSTRKSAKCLSCCTFLILQTVDDVHFYKALLSSPGEEKKKRNRRIMCVCLLVIRCISSLSFLFNDWLLQRGGLYFWSVMILLSGDLKVGKGVKKGTMKGGKILPSFCGFEQPLICTKFRFALLFFQIKDSRESIIQS